VLLKERNMLTSIHPMSYLVRDLGAAIGRQMAIFQGLLRPGRQRGDGV
jgi:hypothetical protein